VVLWVVFVSVLSLHAATVRSASADAEARIIFFISFTSRPKSREKISFELAPNAWRRYSNAQVRAAFLQITFQKVTFRDRRPGAIRRG